MCDKKVFLKSYCIIGDYVFLIYADYSALLISKLDFNRAFGTIINYPKSDIFRDFLTYYG